MMSVRIVSLAIACVLAGGRVAAAQSQQAAQPDRPAAPAVRALTHYNFHLSGSDLSEHSDEFDWIGEYGGDIDLVEVGPVGFNFKANYEVMLGREFRAFDPTQANYTLDLSFPIRFGSIEIRPLFHHLSQHLGDRPKRFAVDWNTIGLSARHAFTLGKTAVEVDGWAGKVIEASYVDYAWQGDAGVQAVVPLDRALELVVRGRAGFIGVDEAVAGRGTQSSGRAEAALRLRGAGARLELFAAYERRPDALPIAREPRTWAIAGFRILSR
jgi:hypothetical protein